jgi:hypothetical protein
MCVYSVCVLWEGNLITCVYASTEKGLIIVLQSHALIVIHLEPCLQFDFIW